MPPNVPFINKVQRTVLHTATIPLMESFYSIQGEGYHQGKAAHFIRLAGCDVGCFWCDVKESWEAGEHAEFRVEEIVSTIDPDTEIVIITGGEPLMYDLEELTLSVRQHGYRTHLETSGAYPLTGSWDWVCLSPKKFAKPVSFVYERADELKVVIYNRHDLKWAVEQAEYVSAACKLYLQPEWSVANKVMPMIVDHVKRDPRWNISLQIHKYLNIR
jgi:organic radical activating enzyme